MKFVTILTTDPLGETAEDLLSDGCRFTFGTLKPDIPRRLFRGPVWAFIDWLTPELSGLELCRRLRADRRTAEAHLIMVLENGNMDDRRRAMSAGADDYTIGPIDRNMVLDRVLACENGNRVQRADDRVSLGNLAIDAETMRAKWQDKPVVLRPNELRLLRFMMENPDRLLSRRDLISGLGKEEQHIDERSVDVWVGRLRRALNQVGAGNLLRTIRSRGYVLDTPN